MNSYSIFGDVAKSSEQTENVMAIPQYNSPTYFHEESLPVFAMTTFSILVISIALLTIEIIDKKPKFRILAIVLSSIMIILSIINIAILYYINTI